MKLDSIQILRGMAALLVLLFHIAALELQGLQAAGSDEAPLVTGLWNNGYSGVDLFFVISGFIMVYVTSAARSGPGTSGVFLISRVFRIYPIWWLLAGFFAFYTFTADVWLDLRGQSWASFSETIPPGEFLLKSFLLIPQAEHPVLGVGWTLIHEMYFYAVFAVTLLLPRRLLPIILVLWAVAVVIGHSMMEPMAVAGTLLRLATYPMTIEFILGAIAGLLICSGRVILPLTFTLIGTALFMFSLCFLLPPVMAPSVEPITGHLLLGVDHFALGGVGSWHLFITQWGRVIFFGVPSVMIIYGIAGLEVTNRLPVASWAVALALVLGGTASAAAMMDLPLLQRMALCGGVALLMGLVALALLSNRGVLPVSLGRPIHKAFVSIGDWSYALYLFHMLLVVGFIRLSPIATNIAETQLGVPTAWADFIRVGASGYAGNAVFLISAFVFSVIGAWLIYRLFEVPVTRALGRWRRARFPKISAGLKPAPVPAQ